MTTNTRLQQLEQQHRTTHQVIPQDFEQFNDLIGLPKHPATLKPMALMNYQKNFFKTIDNTDYHQFHVNKSRQIGFTELILRILAYRCFNKYKGRRIMIIAGTREKTTKKIMQRFRDLFRSIPLKIKKANDSLIVELTNGTVIEGLPANPEAIVGDTKITAIFLDESAKWNLQDDKPVMNAILPIVKTNKSDLFMISTPKGPRGFFYDIEREDNPDFLKFSYNIWEAVGWIYSEEEAKKMLEDVSLDTEQEYLNKFTTGRDSIWGEITEEHRSDEEEMILDENDLDEMPDVAIKEEEPDIPPYAYSLGKGVIYPYGTR